MNKYLLLLLILCIPLVSAAGLKVSNLNTTQINKTYVINAIKYTRKQSVVINSEDSDFKRNKQEFVCQSIPMKPEGRIPRSRAKSGSSSGLGYILMIRISDPLFSFLNRG